VRNCCLHNGFFQITGHAVPIELQKKMMDWNKKFFHLPLEEKSKVNKGKFDNLYAWQYIHTSI
jgi:isopenicillin N synthase-like dioxygenase